MIGEAQIVQLGEQSHGDGKCFETKIRLIKFLHQEMGFDVLAFESGLYDCHRAWKGFLDGENGTAAARLGVFGIWTGSKQTAELWNYLQQQSSTDNVLQLVGFDCQYTAAASRRFLKGDLESLIIDSKFEILEKERADLISIVDQLSNGKIPEGDHQWFVEKLRQLQVTINDAVHLESDRRMFWQQQLKSMISHAQYHWRKDKGGPWSGVIARDAQMADNLNWLASTRFPDRKMIVWAASFHIVRNIQEIEVPDGSVDYSKMTQMGTLVHQNMKQKIFTVGFTAHQGRAGTFFRPSWNIGKAPAGTLEDIFFEAGLKNAIIPLTADWLQEKQFCRPLGYSWMRSDWSRNFDAIIFNQKMTPSTR